MKLVGVWCVSGCSYVPRPKRARGLTQTREREKRGREAITNGVFTTVLSLDHDEVKSGHTSLILLMRRRTVIRCTGGSWISIISVGVAVLVTLLVLLVDHHCEELNG